MINFISKVFTNLYVSINYFEIKYILHLLMQQFPVIVNAKHTNTFTLIFLFFVKCMIEYM